MWDGQTVLDMEIHVKFKLGFSWGDRGYATIKAIQDFNWGFATCKDDLTKSLFLSINHFLCSANQLGSAP